MTQKKLFPSEEKPILTEIPFDIALEVGENIRFLVSEHMTKAEIVGSVRRKKPYCHDIDIVGIATPKKFEKAIRNIKREFRVEFKVQGPKVTKLYISTEHGKIQIDLYNSNPENYGLTKIIRTGSAEHNIWLSTFAISKGYKIKYSKGLLKDGVVVAGETEESVFSMLGLKTAKPEEREVVNRQPVWLK